MSTSAAGGIYSAGTAFLQVVPSFRDVEDAMKDQLRKMGARLDAQTQAGIKQGLAKGASSAGAAGKKAADDFTGAFNRDVQRGLDKAVKDIGDRTATSFNKTWNSAFDKVSGDLKELQKERVGFTIDENTFNRSVENMRNRLRTLEDNAPDGASFYDARGARMNLDKVLGTMEEARRRGSEQGKIFAGAFETQFKQTVAKAYQSIKPITLTANSSDAERDIEQMRRALDALSGKRIGIDISSEAAMAELRRIEERLRNLAADNVDIRVRVDADSAAEGIERFRKNSDDAAISVSNIEKAATLTMSRLQYLIALGASIGSVFVPAAAAAAGAIGFMGTSAIAAAAGIGVLSLGLSGIGEAVGAMQKYHDDQLRSTTAQTTANRGAARSTDGVASAVRNLGNVRRTVAEDAADAERSVADAVREATRARHDQAVEDRDARRDIVDAQRDVTRAEEDARGVREALNRVIKEARENMSDLRVELSRNEQDQNKAVTAQMRALNELHALQANPRASEVELREARDNVNEQTVRLEELAKKRREMQQEQATQAAKGVEGDDKVIAARKRIKDADEKVTDARVRLRRAEQDATERHLKSTQKIEDADRRVDVAKIERQRQRLDGAFQIAQAQAQVASAGRQQLGSITAAAEPVDTALDNLNIAMSKLTPSQQRFAKFIFGLKDEFDQLRAAAADPMLPGFQKAIENLLPYLPDVSSFISRISGQLGSMAIQASDALTGPTWMKFFRYVDQSAVPAMQTWYEITENLTDGLLNLYLSLTPLDGQIGRGLLGLSEDFARWAQTLDKNQGYQEFIAYIRENGPEVVHLFGELAQLALKLLEAYAPIGEVALKVLTMIADGLNSIPVPVLTILVATISALALGIATLGGVLRAQKLKNQLMDIFGDSARGSIQKYAIDTGRATNETGKFRTAVATVAGAAGNVRDKLYVLPDTVGKAFGDRSRSMVDRFAIQTGFAATNAGKFEKAMGTAAGMAQASGQKFQNLNAKVGGVRGAFGSLASFLFGPWGIAIAAVTVGATVLGQASAEYHADIADMASALGDLGKTYGDLETKGQTGTVTATKAIEDLINNNPKLKDAVIIMRDLGVSFDVLGRAAAGNKQDIETMMKVLDEQIEITGDKWKDDSNFLFTVFGKEARASSDKLEKLRKLRDALKDQADKAALYAEVAEVVNKADERNAAITRIKNTHQGANAAIVEQLIGKYDEYGKKIETLNAFASAFQDNTADTTTKAQALRDVIDSQTKSMQDAQTAADDYQRKINDLGTSIQQNGRLFHGNSKAALDNRTAVIAVAKAAQEMYIQDAAAGKPMDVVTRKHRDRIQALLAEAGKGKENRTAVAGLIKTYGEVPQNVKTALETKNFTGVYKEMQKLRFMQLMLEQGKSANEAQQAWKEELKASQRAVNLGGSGMIIPGKATGGPIEGPGTTTSDSVLIRASRDEHMLTAEEVARAGGHAAIYKWRSLLKSGFRLDQVIPGFATGGAIRQRRTATWPFTLNMAGVDKPTLAELKKRFAMGAGLAGDGQVSGSPAMENLMEGAIRGTTVTSAYRPGDGGYHGKQPRGRAIDMVFSDGSERRGGGLALQAFNYIASKFGKGTKELIWDFSPWGLSTGIWNGGRHRFRSSTSGPGSHDDHLHWAYDDGGILPPGVSQVVNMTGKPEAVMNPSQWAAVDRQNDIMQQLVSQANQVGGGGNTYQFEFKDTTLDAAWVRAQQQREDALMRVNRSR